MSQKAVLLLTIVAIGHPAWQIRLSAQADPGCENYQAWQMQSNPRTDATGMRNHAYPEANATYWVTTFTYPLGTVLKIQGQYPEARYMALQVYDDNRNVLSAIADVNIDPDPGTNNPYRTGSVQGTYTIRLVFGREPLRGPEPNTIYTANVQTVGLVYRIYYANNPDDLPGGPVNPVLPNIIAGSTVFSSCPPRPIIQPEDATVWGRLDNIDFVGTRPANGIRAMNPPAWTFSVTNPMTPFYPSQDNSYMEALISRDFLNPPYANDMVVIRMKPPSFTDTQAGVPPYAAANVRFWSMCQDEPMTTSVVRCVPDDKAGKQSGFSTFVISDPSKRPGDSVLKQWGASWIAWGALMPGDVVYDIDLDPLTNKDGVFYYGLVIYRQTMADPNFAQSINNVSALPSSRRQAAMGNYWPVIGYCQASQFASKGAACIGQ
jgi:hypothetical protein